MCQTEKLLRQTKTNYFYYYYLQLSEKLASLDIMGDQLRALLKPLKHLSTMILRGGSQLGPYYAEVINSFSVWWTCHSFTTQVLRVP